MGAYDTRDRDPYNHGPNWAWLHEQPTKDSPEYYTARQAAERLHVSETLVRQAVASSKMGAEKNSRGHWKIPARFVNPWENPYILKWWTPAHDELLAELIAREQWHWYWQINDGIRAITPQETLEAWRAEDSLGRLQDFAVSRAAKLGLTKAIRVPKWKTCPLCGQAFVENSLPVPLARRLGYDHLDFCSPCLSHALWGGRDDASRQEVLEYLRQVSEVLLQVPAQDFTEKPYFLTDLDPPERLPVLRAIMRKPTVGRVKELFGSWLVALVKAGVLENGTRRTTRGTHCIARDGHVCLSLGEKTIDDMLYAHGIPHEKEPRYPEGNYRADFKAEGVFIEYFGLTGDADYDAKTKVKQQLCEKHGIALISIYPEDLISAKRLEEKILKNLRMTQRAKTSVR
jgi:hypothetical protein